VVLTREGPAGSCIVAAGSAGGAPGWRQGGPDILFPGYQEPLDARSARRQLTGPINECLASRCHITGERVS